MKKVVLLLIALIGMTTSVKAQWPFDVTIAKCRFARVIAENVNLRQEPDASSPRLIRVMMDEGGLTAVWQEKNRVIDKWKGLEGPVRASVLPIIGESGDWYQVLFYDESWGVGERQPQKAYIMKKFCEEVPLKPIDSNSTFEGDYVVVPSGKYAGLCLTTTDIMDEGQHIHVGRYVNGVLVFKYYFPYFHYDFLDDEAEPNKKEIFEVYDNLYGIKLGRGFRTNVYDEKSGFMYSYLSLRRLAEDTEALDLMMSILDKPDTNPENYSGWLMMQFYSLEGDSTWHSLDVNDLPEHLKQVVHFPKEPEPILDYGEEDETENEAVLQPEKMPEFRGGVQALMNYLKYNIHYPPVCKENNVQGRVLVQFVVNKDGSIVDPEIVKAVHPSLDKEALRVVSIMPKWTPGEKKGKPVRVKFTLPINFSLGK